MKNFKVISAILLMTMFVAGIFSLAVIGEPNILIPFALFGSLFHGWFFKTYPDGYIGACTLVGWTEACDDDGNIAGIDTIWFASKNDIASFTVASGIITAVTMVATKVFYKWQFEPDTAFFNQPKSIIKRAPFYKQNIQFTNPKMKSTLILALNALDACAICGLVAIIKDNNGKFWVAGVKVFSGGTYSIVGLYPAASDGAQTGANAESDSNQITTAFEAKTGTLARESTIAEGSIPV